jgi:hypothetical protein
LRPATTIQAHTEAGKEAKQGAGKQGAQMGNRGNVCAGKDIQSLSPVYMA